MSAVRASLRARRADTRIGPAARSRAEAPSQIALDPELAVDCVPVPELDPALQCALDPVPLPVSVVASTPESFALCGRASLCVVASGAVLSTAASTKLRSLTPTMESQAKARKASPVSATLVSLTRGIVQRPAAIAPSVSI